MYDFFDFLLVIMTKKVFAERHINPEVFGKIYFRCKKKSWRKNFMQVFVFGDLSLCSIGMRTSESCYFYEKSYISELKKKNFFFGEKNVKFLYLCKLFRSKKYEEGSNEGSDSSVHSLSSNDGKEEDSGNDSERKQVRIF